MAVNNRLHQFQPNRYATLIAVLLVGVLPYRAHASKLQKCYYAYPTVEDKHGVIAPWYKPQNGQCDYRLRIAAETLKRYPWTDTKKAPVAVPEYVFNGHWKIAPDGTITIPDLKPWDNGDLGQRAAYILSAFVDYYRYSGDLAAIAHMTLQADALLDYCQTPADHPWPNFLISVPTHGKVYGQCNPRGMIQLDIVAEVGLPLLRAYQITGTKRWLDAATHWAQLLADKRCRDPHQPPWNRYANPECVDNVWEDRTWEDHQTGGVVFLLEFFDELIRMGITGRDNSIVEARDAGRAYLRDVLLPNWTVDDVWGRNYWDWPDPVQAENVTEFAARYLMNNPQAFPNWRCDARNIMTLFLNRTSVSPASYGDVYHGAWAYPESSGCCGRSLWYGPMELAMVYGQYGVLADSAWAREMARRQIILCTYDGYETGVVEDNIDGGAIVAGGWFKISHPMVLKHLLGAIAWQPEILGPNRENHIVRSSAVVTSVVYATGRIAYSTFDAPPGTVGVLRLAFSPTSVMADGKPLDRRTDLNANGYQLSSLPGGDCILTIRHDGARNILVEGPDPQELADNDRLTYTGQWSTASDPADSGRTLHVSSDPAATMTFSFTGNQVRLIGRAHPTGGLADVYVDDVKQLVGIDCWNPAPRNQQLLYYRNGLAPGNHTLKIVVRGTGNPVSKGANTYIDAVQFSSATGNSGCGEGGGPTEPQRVICGYPGRTDYVDSAGNSWRPATEVVTRAQHMTDSVTSFWWTRRRHLHVANTPDPELYRYGLHSRDFTAYFTVAPGTYHVRLKFAETWNVKPENRAVTTVEINGTKVVDEMDITATAGGLNKAVDLVLNDIPPVHGVIALRFTGRAGKDAIIQAIEVAPGPGGKGATPVRFAAPPASKPAKPGDGTGNLLINPGFEEADFGHLGSLGATGAWTGWKCLFAGAAQSYVWAESAYSIHPDWGLPVIHGGKQALRTHTEGNGHTIVYQDVEASPDTKYSASVWVRADDLHGEGFGTSPCDSAGLIVQELDSQGRIIKDHPKQAVTTKCDYRKLTLSYTTGKQTARIRFVLDTVIAGPYDQGHVTYDDCSLLREK